MATQVEEAAGQSTTQEKWQAFVSLDWYDGVISFLFRFVAKTSEPLLAAGVIVSAADFLLKGELMADSPLLAGIWAWTQAVAIEASTGPVLVFALQAFKARDPIKGWLYTVLAVLLFIVGSAMLFLQMIANVTGVTEANVSLIVIYGLFVLRVIVSSGMVALSCTKHIPFSGMLSARMEATVETPVTVSTPSTEEIVTQVLAHIDTLYQTRLETVMERTIERVTVSVEEQVLAQLPERITSSMQAIALPLQGTYETPVETGESVENRIRAILIQTPDISIRKLATQAHCAPNTASKWKERIQAGS
jgi:hypothetical protein